MERETELDNEIGEGIAEQHVMIGNNNHYLINNFWWEFQEEMDPDELIYNSIHCAQYYKISHYEDYYYINTIFDIKNK